MVNKGSEIILSMGGNIGDTAAVFKAVLTYLQDNMVLDIGAVSSVYRSRSLLQDEQQDYLNIAVCGVTQMEPHAILNTFQDIEVFFGRTPSGHWGERIIDIDMIDMGGIVMTDKRLVLPHPQMQNRSFVLLPMMEIVADYVHPHSGRTLEQMYEALEDKLNIERVGTIDI